MDRLALFDVEQISPEDNISLDTNGKFSSPDIESTEFFADIKEYLTDGVQVKFLEEV